MKKFRLSDMKKGWFVGNFVPTALHTEGVEVAFRPFQAGAKEARHVHRVATEITVICSGEARMNGVLYTAGDIIVLDPHEESDFEGVQAGTVVIVKMPSVPGDKYEVAPYK